MRGIASAVDCETLQSDLVKVYGWAELVNMHFNADKFECLRFWAKQGDAPDFSYLSPDNNVITEKPHLRDLGVEISADFTFKVHITKTCYCCFSYCWLGPQDIQEEGTRADEDNLEVNDPA